MPLILVEENVENFWPLSLTRATFELRYGALSPIERALKQTRDIALRAREELAPYLRAKYGVPVNSDIEGEVFPGLPFATPWEILAKSNKLIAADYEMWTRGRINHRDSALVNGVHVIGRHRDLFIGARVHVQPGTVLDVTDGPIMIAPGVNIKCSYVQGPVFIGAGCTVESARVRPGTSIGAHCKVGGEIAATIFQSRVNKAHDGFVGHTWTGRWVNFGAMATTSNLKNNYGHIRFQRDMETTVDTGVQFLGSLVGDHTKIGILQGLTTGSHIGVGCSIFGGGVAPKYMPSFSWGGAGGWQEYRFDDFLKTVRATLGRRTTVLRAESEVVLRKVFEGTAAEREAFLAQIAQ